MLLPESAPKDWRGGNSRHTRNLRCRHDAPTATLTDSYSEDEYYDDLLLVTGGETDPALARLTIRASAGCCEWMQRHRVRFQPSLGGTLHLSRTKAFFLGGGKALVNAYYRSAAALGVAVRYDAEVVGLDFGNGAFSAAEARFAAARGRRRRRLRGRPRLAETGLGRRGRELYRPRHAVQPRREPPR